MEFLVARACEGRVVERRSLSTLNSWTIGTEPQTVVSHITWYKAIGLPLAFPFRPKLIRTISGFSNQLAASNSIFVVAEICFLTLRIFGVFRFQSHAM